MPWRRPGLTINAKWGTLFPTRTLIDTKSPFSKRKLQIVALHSHPLCTCVCVCMHVCTRGTHICAFLDLQIDTHTHRTWWCFLFLKSKEIWAILITWKRKDTQIKISIPYTTVARLGYPWRQLRTAQLHTYKKSRKGNGWVIWLQEWPTDRVQLPKAVLSLLTPPLSRIIGCNYKVKPD